MGTEVVTTEETYVYPNEDTIVVISGNSGSCVITVEA
jgi:hypothetical protein